MTDRAKGRNLFDPFFVAYDLVTGCALLTEPEHPSVYNSRAKDDLTRKRVRTYVFLRGCTAVPLGDVVFGEVSFDRSAVTVVETEVEKCFEDGNLDRGAAGCGLGGCEEVMAGFGWFVEVLLARKRDCE